MSSKEVETKTGATHRLHEQDGCQRGGGVIALPKKDASDERWSTISL